MSDAWIPDAQIHFEGQEEENEILYNNILGNKKVKEFIKFINLEKMDNNRHIKNISCDRDRKINIIKNKTADE